VHCQTNSNLRHFASTSCVERSEIQAVRPNMRLKLAGAIVLMESECLCPGGHGLSAKCPCAGGRVARTLSAIR
jgi:hypothetical protein